MSQEYQPKQSSKVTRVSFITAEGEGESWKEKLKVCEGVKDDGQPRVFIRSYFVNSRTEERVWDEPPSGATNVVRVTRKMRRKAEDQQRELQETLDSLPTDDLPSTTPQDSPQKKKGFFLRFRRKEPKALQDDSKDLNLQRAIAASMSEQEDVAVRASMEDDEALQMAQALSLSNGESKMSEEEVLQRVLEESREEAQVALATSGVASMPLRREHDLVDESESSHQEVLVVGKSDPNER